MQRSGKYQSRPDTGTLTEMSLKQFCDQASFQLGGEDHDDAAFYFDQVSEHLQRGGKLSNDPDKVRKILGL